MTGDGDSQSPAALDHRGLIRWLVAELAPRLELPPDSLDINVPLRDYQLTSRGALELTGRLEQLLRRPLSADLVWRYPTIDALAAALADAPAAEPSGAHAVPTSKPASVPSSSRTSTEPIAVIGLGCRLPGGVADPHGLWEALASGRDLCGPLPRGRWPRSSRDARAGQVVRGGFLESVDLFDADFFGISAAEATSMDPQQRLLLEVAWEALEHAGVPPRGLAGSATSVVVGAYAAEYGWQGVGADGQPDRYAATGTALSILANRLSYLLDLRGPSLTVDTACSSSLVAVHLAVQGLRSGQADLALAAGAYLNLSPAVTLNLASVGVLAADGRSKAFAADADGYSTGEGVAVVVLKRLSDAERDGDRVLALIRGGAVNQDGRSNGLMAPNPQAQEELLTAAYADAGVDPASVGYVEAHGTGTMLGDPIEAAALGAVLGSGAGRAADRPCLIGSVKTNLGHLQAASGVAGLAKAVLSLHHRQIPPSLHFDKPNPLIPFDRLGLAVAAERTDWKRGDGDGPRRAGVSSFGFGGTSAHLVLEEAPEGEAAGAFRGLGGLGGIDDLGASGGTGLFPLSAGTIGGLREAAAVLADSLESGPAAEAALDDVAYTLAVRRSHVAERCVVRAGDRAALIAGLRRVAAGFGAASASTPRAAQTEPTVVHGAARAAQTDPAVVYGTARATQGRPGAVWVFPGQGSQWPGMGARLLATHPAFRHAVDELEPVIQAEAGFSVLGLLSDADGPEITDVAIVQPLIFAVQVALAAAWRFDGLEPAAVIGHSMGEVAAAVVAGALDLTEGAVVCCRRARILARLAGRGAMAAVELSEARLLDLLAAEGLDLEIAAVSGPHSTVLTGEIASIDRLLARLERDGETAARVRVAVAAHSRQVDAILPDLVRELGELRPRPTTVPFYSSVTGEQLEHGALDAGYWAQNLRRRVRFADAVRLAADAGFTAFVEVSAHPALTHAIRGTLAEHGVPDPVVVPTLLRTAAGRESLLAGLAALHCAGQPVRWDRLYPDGEHVDVPTNRWNHRRYWREPASAANTATKRHALLSEHVVLPAPDGGTRHVWQGTVAAERLAARRLWATVVDFAFAAGRDALGVEPQRLMLERLQLMRMRQPTGPVTVSFDLVVGGDAATLTLSVSEARRWEMLCAGHVSCVEARAQQPELSLAKLVAEHPYIYGVPAAAADVPGERPSLAAYRVGAEPRRSVLAAVLLPERLNQPLADVFGVALGALSVGAGGALPGAIESVAVYGDPSAARVCQATVGVGDGSRGDVVVLDGRGRVLIEVGSIRVPTEVRSVPVPVEEREEVVSGAQA